MWWYTISCLRESDTLQMFTGIFLAIWILLMILTILRAVTLGQDLLKSWSDNVSKKMTILTIFYYESEGNKFKHMYKIVYSMLFAGYMIIVHVSVLFENPSIWILMGLAHVTCLLWHFSYCLHCWVLCSFQCMESSCEGWYKLCTIALYNLLFHSILDYKW